MFVIFITKKIVQACKFSGEGAAVVRVRAFT